MKNPTLALLAAAALCATGTAHAAFYTFAAALSGAAEAPSNDSLGTGHTVVTLDDACIGTIPHRAAHARHWRQQYEEILPVVADLGRDDLQAWSLIRLWAAHVGDVHKHINDMVHDVGFDAIVADDFAGVRELLAQRGLPTAWR